MYRLVNRWLLHVASQVFGNTANAAQFVSEAMEEIGEYFE